MSDKIRLTNGQIFNLSPLGNIKNDTAKTRLFRFTSELPIGEVQTMFRDPENIASIDHLLSDDKLRENFCDCAAYKSIAQDDGGMYTVELSTDTLLKQMIEMQKQMAEMQANIDASKFVQSPQDVVEEIAEESAEEPLEEVAKEIIEETTETTETTDITESTEDGA